MTPKVLLLPFVLVVFLMEPNAQSVPSFVDIGAQAGLTAEGQHHAVAIGDFDNDGDEDIYVGSKFAPNALPERRQHDLHRSW